MSEVGGSDRSGTETPPPGNRFRFRVVRACVRAGEAKLRVNLLLLDRSKTESPLPVRRGPAHGAI